jgi:hypothetical protein
MPGHVIYCGRVDGNHGCGPGYFAAYADPKYKNGRPIIPNQFIANPGRAAEDPSRIRVNNTSVSNVKFLSATAIYE